MRPPDSPVSRYLAELGEKGIVEKRRAENGKLTYCVDERFGPVLSAIFSGSGAGYSAKSSVQDMTLAKASR